MGRTPKAPSGSTMVRTARAIQSWQPGAWEQGTMEIQVGLNHTVLQEARTHAEKAEAYFRHTTSDLEAAHQEVFTLILSRLVRVHCAASSG